MNRLERDGYTVYPISVPTKGSLETYNFYVVKHLNGLSLLDAGVNNEACWTSLEKSLAEQGLSVRDMTEILLTHHHGDHVGLVNRLTKQHDIPVYAHPDAIPRVKRDQEFLTMRVEFFEKLYREMNCGEAGERQVEHLKESIEKNKHLALQSPITSLIEGDTILEFEVIELPGHAPDQIGFYDKKRKWLFGGDHLIQHISSNALVEPTATGERNRSIVQYIDSLHRCSKLHMDTVFSGHGLIINEPIVLIDKRLAGIERKSARILELIINGLHTGSEIAQTLYQAVYEKQFALVMSEVIGHLDLLEYREMIEKKMVNGIWHYYS
ncbi:MBL fold metallo-hydrolase [Bacillus sp. FJAT-45350]|uniref:MBL fold metallo-hydrolase n=1 Tax=Bacillus sp. FJAT-45350 TaxID=2011014 RepID=UPI000BB841C7|nr:MBL fold metallo-hydrolase [Bacillus sp. FJAT-45350]